MKRSAVAFQDRELYEEIVRRILEVIEPEKIILFGSRARADHRPQSDADILVIAPSSKPRYKRAGPLYTALASLPLEVDILVYTPEEIDEWREVPQAFETRAMREGVVLYERAA